MKRRWRRTLVGGCVAAAPVVGTGIACDRSTSPPADNTAVAVPNEIDAEGSSNASNLNASDSGNPSSIENKNASGAPTNSNATSVTDNSISKPAGTFIPPEVDLSNLPDFDREQILKVRESVIEAPGSADRIAELGMQYCAQGFDEAAIVCFKRTTELMPRVMRFHYLLAISYDEKTQAEKAVDAYRAALALDLKYPATYVNLGRLLMEKDPIEARSMFEKAIELDPTDSIAQWGLGRCALADGKEDEALGLFKKAVELQPTYADAHGDIAKILEKRGESAQAQQHKKQAAEGRKGLVKNDPIRFDMLSRLRSEEDIAKEALAAAKKGKSQQAAQFLIRTMRKGYRGAAIHRALGEVLMIGGKPDDALIQFREALKLAPDSIATQILISAALIDLNELDQAESMLKEVAAKEPKRHEVANRLGVIDVKRGRLADAEKKFRSALEADPGNGLYRFALAQCLALEGRNEDALEGVDRTLEVLPDDATVHLLKGRTLLVLKRPADAKAALQKTIELNPEMEQPYVLLAGIARDEDDHAASIRYLEEGNKKLPDSLVIANDLAYTLSTCPTETLRDPERAIDLAKRACAATLQQDVNFLDTLATAYAAGRDFTKAAETLRKAIDRAESLKVNTSDIDGMKSRLADYESRIPK